MPRAHKTRDKDMGKLENEITDLQCQLKIANEEKEKMNTRIENLKKDRKVSDERFQKYRTDVATDTHSLRAQLRDSRNESSKTVDLLRRELETARSEARALRAERSLTSIPSYTDIRAADDQFALSSSFVNTVFSSNRMGSSNNFSSCTAQPMALGIASDPLSNLLPATAQNEDSGTGSGSTGAIRLTSSLPGHPFNLEAPVGGKGELGMGLVGRKKTREQIRDLVKIFLYQKSPDFDKRKIIAEEVGLSEAEVVVWFEDR